MCVYVRETERQGGGGKRGQRERDFFYQRSSHNSKACHFLFHLITPFIITLWTFFIIFVYFVVVVVKFAIGIKYVYIKSI